MISSQSENCRSPSFYPLQFSFQRHKVAATTVAKVAYNDDSLVDLIVCHRHEIFLDFFNSAGSFGCVFPKEILLSTGPNLRRASIARIRRNDDLDGILVDSMRRDLGIRKDILDCLHGCLKFLVSPVSVKRVSDSEGGHNYCLVDKRLEVFIFICLSSFECFL